MKKFTLLLELVNESEAEAGETDRRGWTDSTLNLFQEPELMTLREAIDCLHYVEPRGGSGCGWIYYGHSETSYNQHELGAVEPGDEYSISLVLPKGTTEASARRVDAILRKRGLMGAGQ
jgi:hypothetical protein